MITTIDNQLCSLEKAIHWVKTHLKGERQRSAYDTLVKKRIALKKIKLALEENPAAVLYGESQQGKSYLANAILSAAGSSFSVVDNEAGKEYDFILDINPVGQGAEATSVVTRFTTHAASPVKGYPVKIKLLSVSDIILILCDSYYSDLKEYDPATQLHTDQIKVELQKLKERIENQPSTQSYLQEDDVLMMGDYFEAHFRAKSNYVSDADFFRTVSQFIEKAGINDWDDIFSILWNNNKQLTDLFRNILGEFKKIGFAKEVYTKYTSILRTGAHLLDVTCLHALYNNASATPVEIATEGGNVYTISSSYLCTLVGELVLQLPAELAEARPFLNQTDVLDFPGARARLDKKEQDLEDETYIPQMLLRGKVAYIFNRYSDYEMINTLLFCHGKRQAGPRFMPDLLKTWIEKFIGDTAEERELFMQKSQIAPLFVISTMFNLDLRLDQNDIPGKMEPLIGRWDQRFETVYHNELFGADCKWLDEWTPGKPFCNSYLLRDFYYSSPAEGNIFRGWSKGGGIEQEEVVPANYPEFRKLLRQSFLEHKYVKRHFANPEEAWAESATLNKDGSQYIIRNLFTAAENINEAREDKFARALRKINSEILSELQKYYHDESSDNSILRARQLAGETQASLDIAFGHDPYFFGKMMQCMILNEGDVYRIFHEEFQKDDLVKHKDLGKYIHHYIKAPGLSPQNDFETNLEILAKAYEMTPENCREYFEKRKVDLEDMFQGVGEGMKSPSQSLAELLREYWFKQWLRQNKYGKLTTMIDEYTVCSILDMLEALYDKLNMTQYIAQAIRQYVDKFGTNEEKIQELIADMCAEIMNKFVSTVGYDYLSDDAIASLKEANEKQGLGLSFTTTDAEEEHISPATIADMFEAMDDFDNLKAGLDPERLQYIPGVVSQRIWSELLKIGFIQTQDIPNYDVAANKALGEIKTEIESLK